LNTPSERQHSDQYGLNRRRSVQVVEIKAQQSGNTRNPLSGRTCILGRGSMQDNTLQLSNNTATAVPFSKKIPFTKYDFGWVLLCIGMAIGAGTVLMPVQIGLTGIWVFIVAFIIAYPATYIVQDIYLKHYQKVKPVMTTRILSVIIWEKTGAYFLASSIF
jgi:hypothetical protein